MTKSLVPSWGPQLRLTPLLTSDMRKKWTVWFQYHMLNLSRSKLWILWCWRKENNQIMSLKSLYWKDWPDSRSEIYSQYTISIKEKWPEVGLCTTFLTLGVKRRGLGNSCAIKNVWPHKLTLNLSPYSFFLISLPSTAWLFPFISTVSFGVGEGPQTLEMPAGPAFCSLQDLMSTSCLKQLKIKLLTNWEWCYWCNVNYGDRGGTIRATGPKNQSLAALLLLLALWHWWPQRVSDNVNMREGKRTIHSVCVCVFLLEENEWRPDLKWLWGMCGVRCTRKVHGFNFCHRVTN